MNKVQILIVGNTEQDAARIVDQVTLNNNWIITAAVHAEEAISIFQQYDFDIVLFSDQLDEMETKKLSRLFRFQYPEVVLTELNNNNAGIVLEEAFQKRKRIHRPVYAFKDNALKNAISNIQLS